MSPLSQAIMKVENEDNYRCCGTLWDGELDLISNILCTKQSSVLLYCETAVLGLDTYMDR